MCRMSYLQLYCYLLFPSFYSSSPTEIQTPSARCCANTWQEKKESLPPMLTIRPAQKNTPARHAWGTQRAGRRIGAGVRGGAEPACQRQPRPCPGLPLSKGFLVGLECLTPVQESGTCRKVPGLCPEGGIQCGGIKCCFIYLFFSPPVIFDR